MTEKAATIKISKADGKCEIEACRVRIEQAVRWYGDGTAACVMFVSTAWPFSEEFQGKIGVPRDGYSDTFTPVLVRELKYDYRCKPCAAVTSPAGPGGADMIIDP